MPDGLGIHGGLIHDEDRLARIREALATDHRASPPSDAARRVADLYA